uniref:Uncharacterized protein n=1 Tax=viral metagenome TaxID=1070528 RepID=A0A6C0E275_9ZZZZ
MELHKKLMSYKPRFMNYEIYEDENIKHIGSFYDNNTLLLRYYYTSLGSYDNVKSIWMWGDIIPSFDKRLAKDIQKIRQNINSDFSKKDYCVISTDDLHKNCIMIEKLFDKQVSSKSGVRHNISNYFLIDKILLNNLE